MRDIIIHTRGSRAKHIPRKALRSSLYHFVTCKVCRRQRWPDVALSVRQSVREALAVTDIHAGEQ